MARVGGAFPLPIAQVAEGGFKIELATGGFYYPGPNEGLVVCGSNTNFEYFDPIAQGWRVLYDAGQGGFASVDGYNFRFHNITGCVTGTAVTAAGSGATTNGIGSSVNGVSATISAGSGATIPASLQTVIGGSVQAPTIAQAGTGFLVPPLIVIDPPPQGGTQATAVCTLASVGGGLASVSMVAVGAGYSSSPNFWIVPQTNQYQGGPEVGVTAGTIPPPGLVFPTNAVEGNQNTSPTGAQLTSNALTGSGTLTDLKLIYPGNNYTGTPTVTISGGGISGATGTVTVGNTTPVNDVSFFLPRVQ